MINEQSLDFLSFLKINYPNYVVDGHNGAAIKSIGLWAIRSPSFNKKDASWHIDKGICISGNIGTGKTELFYMLNRYLNYLKSPYIFSGQVVWKFAEQFKKDGYSCFDVINYHQKNIYFDELALTNDGTLNPMREYVGHFGDKLVIGQEIIMQMYNKFKENAYQAHFSTNCSPDDLRVVYGERAFSRLHEMCNFIAMTGPDRRQNADAGITFRKNKNQATPPPPANADIDGDSENILILERHYLDYLEGKQPSTDMSLIYNMLWAYGVNVASDEIMRDIMTEVQGEYVPDGGMLRGSKSDKEQEKKTYIWRKSRTIAVNIFFEKMKAGDAKSIFGVKNIDDIKLPEFKKE